MKLMTSGMLDPICSFPQQGLGSVCFVASAPRDKSRMVGHANGYIKMISINALKVTSIYKVALGEDETITCGVYGPSGHNFAIGTSHGTIYLGMMKRDPMSNSQRNNMFLSRVDQVSHGSDTAVTSIQLTSFDPQGCVLAAFDNGQVRCWHSSVSHEVYLKLKDAKKNKRSKKKESYELSEFGETQFDVVDKFDMFENPHGIEDLTEQAADNLRELYGVSIYINTFK